MMSEEKVRMTSPPTFAEIVALVYKSERSIDEIKKSANYSAFCVNKYTRYHVSCLYIHKWFRNKMNLVLTAPLHGGSMKATNDNGGD